MSELSTLDVEALRLIAKFEDATARDIEDALSPAGARQLLREVLEYAQPGAPLSEDTRSLIAQLVTALPEVPDGGWRVHVWGLAYEAARLLLVRGVKA